MHFFHYLKRTARGAFTALLLCGAAAGCAFWPPASEPVRDGDTVAVSSACRTPGGILVATSDRQSGQEAVRLWRDVFLLDETLTAGQAASPPQAGAPTPEETRAAIQERLAAHLAGMRPGEWRQVTLTAEPRQGLPEAERFLTMARVRRHPLQREVALERFLSVTSQEAPQLGFQTRFEPGIPRQVSAFDDQHVTLSVALADGDAVDTPLGPGTARLTDDGLAVEVQVRPGDLVSLGPFLGQVDRVDERLIHLDFGHPFGGRALECTLRVEAVTARAEPEPAIPALAAGVQPGDRVLVTYRQLDPPPPTEPLTESLVAGEAGGFPGLAFAVLGMQEGEQRRVTLSPEEAFGAVDPAAIVAYPRTRELPRTLSLETQSFVERFGKFPRRDDTLDLMPYVEARVTEVTAHHATIALAAQDGAEVIDDFGTTRIAVSGDRITLTLDPRLGADFSASTRQGRIVAADAETFSVDYNHPLAGRPVTLELRVDAHEPAATPSAGVLPWMSDYLAAAARAHREQKPMVVLLTAEWCPWCREMQSRTLTDPRLVRLHDRYVWVRVDVDQDPETAAHFDRQAVPLLVVLDAAGSEVRRFEGFTEAGPLLDVLAPTPAGESAPAAGWVK